MSQTKAELINAKGDAAFDTNTLFVDATNNRVGIGTTSVSERLEVNGAVRVTNESAGWGSGTEGGFLDYYAPAQQVRFGHLNGASGSARNVVCYTGGSEAFRVDSSRRLLVGTSSSSANALLTVAGYPGVSTGVGVLQIKRGSNATATDTDLGTIWFGDGLGDARATITASSDAAGGAGDLPSRLVFSTTADGASSPTERMRITSTGYVGFNTSSFTGQGQLATNQGTNYYNFGANNSNAFIVYNSSNTGVYLVSGNTGWSANSDERLKTNLEPIADGLNKVGTLRAVTGRYKTDDEAVSRSFLIAQDVQQVLPEAVDVQEDEDKTLGLRYTEVIPLLVAALKESKERIEALEAEVAALKG